MFPKQATETSEATITPPVPPTSIPANWKTFTNSDLNLTLRYPENWQAQTATRVSGPEGFFELSTRDYPASEFDRLVNLCVLDANDPNLTVKYGPLPFISNWQGWDLDVKTFTYLHTLDAGENVYSLAWSPDETKLAAGVLTLLPNPTEVSGAKLF